LIEVGLSAQDSFDPKKQNWVDITQEKRSIDEVTYKPSNEAS
jgi:hypothetical protein